MKRLLLSLGVVLLSLSGHAQFTRTYTGALVATDPTIPGDRLLRDATTAACGATKAYPGTSAGARVHYDAYTVGNSSTTASTCVTITLTPNCTDATGAPLFVSVYSGSFVPTNLATNYKSDMGSSPLVGSALSMGVTLAPSQTAVIVVSGVLASSICNNYSLALATPIALPIQASHDGSTVALSAYPNPVADVLHITATKAGSYTLYSATGAAVRQFSGSDVSLRELPGGVYMLQQNESKAMMRIVKL